MWQMILMKYPSLFFSKIRKLVTHLSSTAVVVDTLKVSMKRANINKVMFKLVLYLLEMTKQN